jgi:hypothetical protein
MKKYTFNFTRANEQTKMAKNGKKWFFMDYPETVGAGSLAMDASARRLSR